MRNLIALLTALALPAVASAATLTVETDKLAYLPGETVTVTVYGDSEGELSTTYSLFGRLSYDPNRADPGTVGSALNRGPGWFNFLGLDQGDGSSICLSSPKSSPSTVPRRTTTGTC